MTELMVGPTGAVQGRLPNSWRIAARFDSETRILKITSPDTNRFSIDIDITKLDDNSPSHKPTSGTLEDACLEAKYNAESGVLRYDTAEVRSACGAGVESITGAK